KRDDTANEGRAERPKREFRRDDRAVGGGERRPFRTSDEERKPFRKAGDDRPPRAGDRAGDDVRPGRRERAAAEQGTGGEERVARRLARVGVASRRDAEEMIAAGRVSVNGKVLE